MIASEPGRQWSRVLDAETDRAATPAPHLQTLGIPKLEGWEPGRVWTTWSVDVRVVTPMGPVFGGYIAALADHMMACAMFSVLQDGESFATSDLHMNFLRPIRDGAVTIEAMVVNQRSGGASCEAWFKDASRRPLARGFATQAVRAARDGSPAG